MKSNPLPLDPLKGCSHTGFIKSKLVSYLRAESPLGEIGAEQWKLMLMFLGT